MPLLQKSAEAEDATTKAERCITFSIKWFYKQGILISSIGNFQF